MTWRAVSSLVTSLALGLLLAAGTGACGQGGHDARPSGETSASSSAPPPALPPAPPEPPGPDEESSTPVVWNAWFEKPVVSGQTTLRHLPTETLPAGKPVLFGLHLSAMRYGAQSVIGAPASRQFRDELDRWRKTTEDVATVTAILIVDTKFFEGPGYVQKTLTIELGKLRSALAGPVSPEEPFARLTRGDKSFVFAEKEFALTTKNVNGRAGIAVLIWDDENRPLEELRGSICVGAAACPPAAVSTSGDQYSGAFATSAPDSEPLDAIVHVFTMEKDSSVSMYGLLHTSEGKLVWPLERHPDSLRTLLGQSMFQAFATAATDEQWLRHGDSLRNLLFPSRLKPASDALNLLRRAIARRGDARARVYIRMLDGEIAPVLFPLGAMTLDNEPLAMKADVILPLRVQSYVRPTACMADWQIVAPPLGIGDKALDEATQGAANTLSAWRARAKWPPPDSLGGFGKWMDGPDPLPASVIFVLSHHDKNGLIRFTDSDVLTPTSPSRVITEPTVIILNACGGAQASAASFVDELNSQGASTFITTITEVGAPLAADFTNCLNTELASGGARGAKLSDVFRRTIRCVTDIKDGAASKHGLTALKYVLLGDGEVSICPPTQSRSDQ